MRVARSLPGILEIDTVAVLCAVRSWRLPLPAHEHGGILIIGEGLTFFTSLVL